MSPFVSNNVYACISVIDGRCIPGALASISKSWYYPRRVVSYIDRYVIIHCGMCAQYSLLSHYLAIVSFLLCISFTPHVLDAFITPIATTDIFGAGVVQ